MNRKQIIFLGILLVLLIVGVTVKEFQKPAELTKEEYVPLALSLRAESVEKIEIEKKVTGAEQSQKPVLFALVAKAKEGQKIWRIPDLSNARADKAKIERLIKDIHEAKGELRGKGASLHKDFGLEEEKALRVSFYDAVGADLLTLFIGEKRFAAGEIFIRQKDSDSVYLVNTDLLSRIGIYGDSSKEKPTSEFWAALNLFNFDPSKVEQLEASRLIDGKLTVVADVIREIDPNDPAKRKWKYQRTGLPFALDAEKVRKFLDELKTWNAMKALAPEPGKNYGFDHTEAQMKIRLEGNKEILIKGGDKDTAAGSYFMQVSTEPTLYKLGDYYFNSFQIDDSKFFISNPLGVDPEKTRNLMIHTDTKELNLKPMESKPADLANYLNNLMSVAPERLLFKSEEAGHVKSPGRLWVQVQREGGEPVILDVGETVPGGNKEYAAKRRDGTQPFTFSEVNYKRLFDNLQLLESKK